jgi:hypothetical protein
MQYKKITLELIVLAEEADAVVAGLNTALDQLDQQHALFGGDIATVAFEHPGKRRKSALDHTLAAGETVAEALRTARESVTGALRTII